MDASDPDEFVEHYRKLFPRLTLIAVAITGDRGSAEDIVQEAAMIAVEKADRFTPGTSFAAWIAQIVRGCALNQRRKMQHRKTFPTDPTILANFTDGGAATSPSAVSAHHSGDIPEDQTDFDDRLVRALNTLSQEARCCLLLRTVEKLTYAEISDLMQIPEGTAMSHVHRSKAALRRQLGTSLETDRWATR